VAPPINGVSKRSIGTPLNWIKNSVPAIARYSLANPLNQPFFSYQSRLASNSLFLIHTPFLPVKVSK